MTVLLSLSINAQEIKSLTLQDAVVYALENKADAKKARLQVEKANTKFKKFVQGLCLKLQQMVA